MSGRPINQSRMIAVLNGDKTYTGTPHDRCNTTERYVSGGGCVHCARVIATEQREARRWLKQQATDQNVNHGHINDLDDADQIAIEDAEARHLADIDSLM